MALKKTAQITTLDIYQLKKSKQPDYLSNLMNKMRYSNENQDLPINNEIKRIIKKQIIEKRVNNILKIGSQNKKVSEPVPFVKKKWKCPLVVTEEEPDFNLFKEKKDLSTQLSKQQEQVKKVLKILDINRNIKYYGEFLKIQFLQSPSNEAPTKLTQKQSKIAYLSKRFATLEKQLKPKLAIMNFSLQQKLTFSNILENDEFYQSIMRVSDQQLMQTLISTLEINGHFTLTSYATFYDIFVWQNAQKNQQIQFVTNLLMGELKDSSISKIGKIIDMICKKINIETMSKSLDNFGQIMKKLIFGDDYEHSIDSEYYITRKALVESLQKNEECISIFINIFYSG